MNDAQSAWSEYWATSSDNGCLPGAPIDVRQKLESIWSNFARSLPISATVCDIASGAGAVLKSLRDNRPDLLISGVDYATVSAAAAALGVRGNTDVATLSIPSASYDAVTSQFGLEYCSDAAWKHSVRVLKPNGHLCFICHHTESRLLAHNRARLSAMRSLDRAGLFSMAIDMAQGAAENLQTARVIAEIRSAHADQSIVNELPQALGQALNGPNSVKSIVRLAKMAGAEIQRLTDMSNAALDKPNILRRIGTLSDYPFTLKTNVLLDSRQIPIAWIVQN